MKTEFHHLSDLVIEDRSKTVIL